MQFINGYNNESAEMAYIMGEYICKILDRVLITRIYVCPQISLAQKQAMQIKNGQ